MAELGLLYINLSNSSSFLFNIPFSSTFLLNCLQLLISDFFVDFGVFDLAQKRYFSKASKIVVLHTGGLQGKLSII